MTNENSRLKFWNFLAVFRHRTIIQLIRSAKFDIKVHMNSSCYDMAMGNDIQIFVPQLLSRKLIYIIHRLSIYLCCAFYPLKNLRFWIIKVNCNGKKYMSFVYYAIA